MLKLLKTPFFYLVLLLIIVAVLLLLALLSLLGISIGKVLEALF